jgi:sigma-B regulation protein RsbU (phosphoserine phosphatase)
MAECRADRPLILVADDDPVHRRLVEAALVSRGFAVVSCRDGDEAWAGLARPDAPELAVLDWVMPGLDGPEICRRVRAREAATPTYLILLTANDRVDQIVAGLEAGADDYLTKPCRLPELVARVRVGLRVVELQRALADRVAALEEALARVKQLQGLLPICAYCKRIRDDRDYWDQVESYLARHADVQFSHGICPECFERVMREEVGRDPGR